MGETGSANLEGRQPITRKEATRSLEDAKKFKALEALTRVGFLIPANQIEAFHGRVGKKSESWQVDPAFRNHGNSTGNQNINSRSTLYSSDAQVAKDFALARALKNIPPSVYASAKETVKNYTPKERQEWLNRLNQREKEDWENTSPSNRNTETPKIYTFADLNNDVQIYLESRRVGFRQYREKMMSGALDIRPEVHEILTTDPDATVINSDFTPIKLSDENKAAYDTALATLAIPITEGAPVSFQDRDAVEKFARVITQRKTPYILEGDVADMVKTTGLSEPIVLQLASAYNSRQIALTRPALLAHRMLQYPTDRITASLTIGGEEEHMPLNLEYAERYMRQAHIVGITQRIDSATLDREVTSISFFDLQKIGTREQIDKQNEATAKKLGGLKNMFPQFPPPEAPPDAQKLFRLLNDAHAKPERLLEAAKQVFEFGNLYESDAGNWEGYTLEEHTETVLRNFDENFADSIPVEYIAPLRLAFLIHDLGKPFAVSRGEKDRQKEYNRYFATNFLQSIGINQSLRDLTTAIITDGSDLAFQLQKQPENDVYKRQMDMYATDVLKRYLNTDAVDTSQKDAFVEMCKIFQTCDGGAYTDMAITRRPDAKGRFRNAPSFNKSFAEPVGLGKRDIRYPTKE